MATAEEVKQSLTKVQSRDLRSLIEQASKELARALPEHMRAERLGRIALTCIRVNPELSKCTPESFLGSLFVSAQLGIEPVGGRAYILPFNNRRLINGEWSTVKEAQFILGYKGLAELFYRHEKAVMLAWGVVHKNDGFEYEYGTEAKLVHKPAGKDRGPVVGFYVIATLAGGGKPFMYMSLEDCLSHGKKHSKTYDKKKDEFYSSSPWATNTEAMCLKTVLVQLGKLLPLSVEIQKAIAADETSRDYRRGIDDAMDLTPTTTWEAEVLPTTKPEAQEAETIEPETTPEEPTQPQADIKDSRIFLVKSVSKATVGKQEVFVIRPDGSEDKFFSDSEDIAKTAKGAKDSVPPIKVKGGVQKVGDRVWLTDLVVA